MIHLDKLSSERTPFSSFSSYKKNARPHKGRTLCVRGATQLRQALALIKKPVDDATGIEASLTRFRVRQRQIALVIPLALITVATPARVTQTD
jgi:hypothetical protein